MNLQQAAKRLRFGNFQEVAGRRTVADLLPAGRRTGLYILGFQTGETYAGLSIDIAARFVQHARTHADIISFAARSVARRQLDTEETKAIERLERWGFRLRNIAKASSPSLEADLDAVVPVQEQERFVRTGTLRPMNLPIPALRDLRRRYLRRFGELMSRPEGLDAAAGLALYLAHAIPNPPATQASFWSATAAVRSSVHIRVNVHWQEVLTVYTQNRELHFSLHVARSPLAKSFGSSLRTIQAHLPAATVSTHRYSPGGVDQIKVDVLGLDGLATLLRVPCFAMASRLFNMRLMRKGPCTWGRHHCPQLADLAGRLRSAQVV
ncbi:MAG: hypothetical protein HY281_00815 [Nitrospirae bacterium]|nr:hypothetical protein [Nitrospirota bacterium]